MMNTKNTLAILESAGNGELAIQQRLDQNPAAVYLAGLTFRARRVQRNALNRIAGILTNGALNDCLATPWAKVEYQHAQAIRSVLIEHYKAASTNRMLSALREVLRHTWLLGQIPAEQYLRVAQVKNAGGETIPAGRELTTGEIAALMAGCEKDLGNAGVRDAAIIALGAVVGLRRDEMVNIDLADYDQHTDLLKVLGKGNKERTTYLTNGARMAMRDWLAIRGSEPGPLFMPISYGNDKVLNRRMTNQAVYNLLQKRAKLAGVKAFSPHDLRRTFISNLLAAGADIATVSKMAGHSNVNTTARYDRRPEESKRKAAELLFIPYTPRTG